MNITDLLSDDAKGLLSEESLIAIQEAYDRQVELAVEAALEEQDEEYATHLKQLVEKIDSDHSAKMVRVLESVDNSATNKLVKIVKLYDRELTLEQKKFKKNLVSSISSYIDEYLEECVSTEELKAAVKNKLAFNVLDNLRTVLAVDSAVMQESIQKAVLDGKDKMVKLESENKVLRDNFKSLYEENQKVQKDLFLESKISKFADDKKNFIKKTFSDKSLDFIKENLDYAVRLFEKAEKDKLKVIKEEAVRNRTVKPDFVKNTEKVVTENVNNNNATAEDPYVSELAKVR